MIPQLSIHQAQPLPDQVLLAQFREHLDQAALWTLISRYRSMLRQVLVKWPEELELEEFMHEVYLLLFDKLQTCGEIRNFASWFKTMMYHRMYDSFRKDKTVKKYEEHCRHEFGGYQPDWDRDLDRSALATYALAQVNEKEAACLYLRYHEGLDYRAIAEEL
ncbi:MAG: sigma-70 family RNA polymerase sigma factor, partial [Bacteroidota bacterium]